MKVIGLVGLPASGKGECSSIAGELGIPVVIMGDIIRAYAQDEGVEATDQHLGTIARRLREERGMAALAELTVPAVKEHHAPILLIDGIRGVAEVQYFRSKFDDFTLIAIDCPFHLRLSRLQERGRSDDTLSEADLRSRDDRECSFGLGEAMNSADRRISNTGSLQSFCEEVRRVLQELRDQP
ncbi:dephospho-CoA kinase [Methanocalculus alkaliphilus]|uniref:AAA family ATPase n=1 Tax=Methanocalculus alkaliphilus TaxID=768730 RepID=UPI0020A0E78E|nr:AAA family ATPase [Methanocalculus alkaliphilus]MCP1714601.1 dephospho-CoA kinase [Methanocalculus alkaliphilus]